MTILTKISLLLRNYCEADSQIVYLSLSIVHKKRLEFKLMYNTKKNTTKWPTFLILVSFILTIVSIFIQNQFSLFSFPIFLGVLIIAVLLNTLSLVLASKSRNQAYTILLFILNVLIIAFIAFTIYTLLFA